MSLKESNEITVKIKGKIEDLYSTLEEQNYTIKEKFNMDDSYFVPKDLKLDEMTEREILAKAILIRKITRENGIKITKCITFKIKEFNSNGDILRQEAINCDVVSIEDAKRLLSAIGYFEIMNIKENDIVYKKGEVSFAIKDIENGDNLIEIETEDKDGFRTIEELKETINKLNIPIEKDNYFVKKAEIELRKILKRQD